MLYLGSRGRSLQAEQPPGRVGGRAEEGTGRHAHAPMHQHPAVRVRLPEKVESFVAKRPELLRRATPGVRAFRIRSRQSGTEQARGRYEMRNSGKRGWCRFHVSKLNTMQSVTIGCFHCPDEGPFSGSLRLRASVRAESSASVNLSKAMMTQ